VFDEDRIQSMPATVRLVIGEPSNFDKDIHYYSANLTGRWDRTRGSDIEYRRRVGLMDNRSGDGSHQADFETVIDRDGLYRVAIAFPAAGNRATAVPVTVTHSGGEETIFINQRRKPGPFAFMPVGEFRFHAGERAHVNISNKGADGIVVVDSVRWIWIGE
jgi:hypothetical protein